MEGAVTTAVIATDQLHCLQEGFPDLNSEILLYIKLSYLGLAVETAFSPLCSLSFS